MASRVSPALSAFLALSDTQNKLRETVDRLEGCRGRNPFAPK
jgi:hypothetical protein